MTFIGFLLCAEHGDKPTTYILGKYSLSTLYMLVTLLGAGLHCAACALMRDGQAAEEVQCEGVGSHLLERRFQPCEVGFIFISPHFKDEETKTCINNMPEVTFNECWSQDSDSSLFNLEPMLYYLSFE